MYWCPGSQHQHTSSSASARQSIPSIGGMVILKADLPGSPYATTPPGGKNRPIDGPDMRTCLCETVIRNIEFCFCQTPPVGATAGGRLSSDSDKLSNRREHRPGQHMAVLLAVVACRGGAHLDELATLITSPPCSTPTKSLYSRQVWVSQGPRSLGAGPKQKELKREWRRPLL